MLDKLIAGLIILKAAGADDMAAGYQCLRVGHESLPLTIENRSQLKSMGWFIDEESWTFSI